MRSRPLHPILKSFARSVRASPWKHLSERSKVAGLTLTSLATNELAPLTLIGELFFLILVFYTTYLLAKPILAKLYPSIADDTGLRLILTLPAIALVYGITWGTNLFYFDITWNMDVSVLSIHHNLITIVLIGTPILLDTYLTRTTTPNEYPHAYARRYGTLLGEPQWKLRAEPQRIADADEHTRLPLKTMITYESRILLALTITFPFFVWGGLLALFEGFYPALELALLTGAALGTVIARRSNRFDDETDLLAAIDTEEQSTQALLSKNIFHPKWLSSVILIAANILVTTGLFLAGILAIILLLTTNLNTGQASLAASVLGFSAITAIIISILTFSLYALWFWRVELARLPRFISHWRTVHDHTTTTNDEPATTLKTRPPWGMLPAAILFIVTVATYPVLTSVSDTSTAIRIVLVTYIVLWACGMLFVGWTVSQWYKCDPQPIENESRVLVGNCLLQMLALASLPAATLDLHSLARVGTVTIALIFLFYLFDVIAYLRNKFGNASMTAWTPLIVAPAILLVIQNYLSNTFVRVATIIAVALLPTLIIIQQTQSRIIEKHAPLDDYKPDEPTHYDDSF